MAQLGIGSFPFPTGAIVVLSVRQFEHTGAYVHNCTPKQSSVSSLLLHLMSLVGVKGTQEPRSKRSTCMSSEVLLEHTMARLTIFANVNNASSSRKYTNRHSINQGRLRNILDRKLFQKSLRKKGGFVGLFSYRGSRVS